MYTLYQSLLQRHEQGEVIEPLVLQLLITNVCNLECRHCFAWETNNNSTMKDLTYEEYERIASTMGPIGMLMIGGGEPFLRKDLADVVRLFVRTNGVGSVGIATNGFNANRTVSVTEQMLRENPGTAFGISLSIDGPEAIHNEIRRHPKAFANMMHTWELMKNLQERHANLAIGVSTVVNAYNQEALDDMYDLFVHTMQPDHINVLLIRQNPSDPKSKDRILIDRYEKFVKRIEQYALRKKFPTAFSALARASQLLAYRLVSRTVRTGVAQIDCMAGRGSILIDNEGSVFACEIRKQIGNLRQNGYDFEQLFRSEAADRERMAIRTCFCTHETQGLVPSIPFSQAHREELNELTRQLLAANDEKEGIR